MLINKLFDLQQKRFTGIVEIGHDGKVWIIYFCFGRIIWADGGYHPYRSWKRIIIKNCDRLVIEKDIICDAENFECWNYRILNSLLENRQIDPAKFDKIVKTKLIEIVFDLLYLERKERLEYNIKVNSAAYLLGLGLKISLVLFPVEEIVFKAREFLEKVERSLKKWENSKGKVIKNWSLDLAPLVTDRDKLAETIKAKAYERLVKLMDGKRSIRDLAVSLDRDVLVLSDALMPYVKRGSIDLIEIVDLPKTDPQTRCMGVSGLFSPYEKIAQPLIACVDDSKLVCEELDKIVTQQGYRFVSVQDSLKASVYLIKKQPDLIFLDLLMPVVNGYEICAQLRKAPILKEVPIIILTGKDGVVDRMRAKLVGATEYISKPISSDKIIYILSKYLSDTKEEIAHSMKSVLTISPI